MIEDIEEDLWKSGPISKYAPLQDQVVTYWVFSRLWEYWPQEIEPYYHVVLRSPNGECARRVTYNPKEHGYLRFSGADNDSQALLYTNTVRISMPDEPDWGPPVCPEKIPMVWEKALEAIIHDRSNWMWHWEGNKMPPGTYTFIVGNYQDWLRDDGGLVADFEVYIRGEDIEALYYVLYNEPLPGEDDDFWLWGYTPGWMELDMDLTKYGDEADREYQRRLRLYYDYNRTQLLKDPLYVELITVD